MMFLRRNVKTKDTRFRGQRTMLVICCRDTREMEGERIWDTGNHCGGREERRGDEIWETTVGEGQSQDIRRPE